MRKLLAVAAVLCVSLFLLMFAVYSARGLFAPELMSGRFFGLPAVDADGTLYYRVYLSRNLAIVVAGFVFLIRRQWQPLAVLTTAAMALPVFDATVLYVALGGATRFAAHVSTFVVIGLAAVFLWLRVRNAGS
jgi:Domain of unknown function (DUF4267)